MQIDLYLKHLTLTAWLPWYLASLALVTSLLKLAPTDYF